MNTEKIAQLIREVNMMVGTGFWLMAIFYVALISDGFSNEAVVEGNIGALVFLSLAMVAAIAHHQKHAPVAS